MPSWPDSFRPQVHTLPSAPRATTESRSMRTVRTPLRPGMRPGTDGDAVDRPRASFANRPQVQTLPSVSTAAAWAYPAATELTARGMATRSLSPRRAVPVWVRLVHDSTDPSLRSASAIEPLELIECTLPVSGTAAGLGSTCGGSAKRNEFCPQAHKVPSDLTANSVPRPQEASSRTTPLRPGTARGTELRQSAQRLPSPNWP